MQRVDETSSNAKGTLLLMSSGKFMCLCCALSPRQLYRLSSQEHNQDEPEGVNEFIIIALKKEAYATYQPSKQLKKLNMKTPRKIASYYHVF